MLIQFGCGLPRAHLFAMVHLLLTHCSIARVCVPAVLHPLLPSRWLLDGWWWGLLTVALDRRCTLFVPQIHVLALEADRVSPG